MRHMYILHIHIIVGCGHIIDIFPILAYNVVDS